MEDNFYAVPKVYGETVTDQTPRPDFYVVSPTKFLWLYLLTMGLYGPYWNYKNWAIYREKNRLDASPFWRAVFSIFFTHNLFGKIDEVGRRNPQLLTNALSLATPVVAILVVSSILSRLGTANIGSPLTDLAGLAAVFLEAVLLVKVQKDINAACADAEGLTNARLTTWNLLWMLLGALLWLFGLYGIFAGPV